MDDPLQLRAIDKSTIKIEEHPLVSQEEPVKHPVKEVKDEVKVTPLLRALYNEDKSKDMRIISAESQAIECHSAVFTNISAYTKDLLKHFQPGDEICVYLPDMTGKAVRAFLQRVYCVNTDPEEGTDPESKSPASQLEDEVRAIVEVLRLNFNPVVDATIEAGRIMFEFDKFFESFVLGKYFCVQNFLSPLAFDPLS